MAETILNSMTALDVEVVEKTGKSGYLLRVQDQKLGELLVTEFTGINVGIPDKTILINESGFAGETKIRNEKMQEKVLEYFKENHSEDILR